MKERLKNWPWLYTLVYALTTGVAVGSYGQLAAVVAFRPVSRYPFLYPFARVTFFLGVIAFFIALGIQIGTIQYAKEQLEEGERVQRASWGQIARAILGGAVLAILVALLWSYAIDLVATLKRHYQWFY